MDEIKMLCDWIVGLIQPEAVILFSQKAGLDGKISSFKLCVVANGNPAEVEGKIYLSVDCPLPFDVLVYSPEDWERLRADDVSFAGRIYRTGRWLYGAQG